MSSEGLEPVYVSICTSNRREEGESDIIDLLSELASTIDIPDEFVNHSIEILPDGDEESEIIFSDAKLQRPSGHERSVVVINPAHNDGDEDSGEEDLVHIHPFFEYDLYPAIDSVFQDVFSVIPDLHVRNVGMDFAIQESLDEIGFGNLQRGEMGVDGVRLSSDERSLQITAQDDHTQVRFYNNSSPEINEDTWDSFVDDNIEIAEGLIGELG